MQKESVYLYKICELGGLIKTLISLKPRDLGTEYDLFKEDEIKIEFLKLDLMVRK